MISFLEIVFAASAAAPGLPASTALGADAALASGANSRATATATASMHLRLKAPAGRAFVLFDPVNEARWDPDWKPTLLGTGRVAAGLAFVTKDGHERTVWLLDRFDPAARTMRYVVLRKSTLDTIDIAVTPDGRNAARATVTYARTALDPRADAKVRRFATHFGDEAPHWEEAINDALARETAP